VLTNEPDEVNTVSKEQDESKEFTDHELDVGSEGVEGEGKNGTDKVENY
jgi:uncharacterized protein YabE (DUF348 family)